MLVLPSFKSVFKARFRGGNLDGYRETHAAGYLPDDGSVLWWLNLVYLSKTPATQGIPFRFGLSIHGEGT